MIEDRKGWDLDPFGLRCERLHADVETFSCSKAIRDLGIPRENVEFLIRNDLAKIVVKALSRDVSLKSTTRDKSTKTTEKNRTRQTVRRGSLPRTILDHLKLAIYPPVARYIRWAKQQERYRRDGGRELGIAFCRFVRRHLRPDRATVWVNYATYITNRIENRVVEETHVHRHLCPHVPIQGSTRAMCFEFLASPDRTKAYLVAFAQSLLAVDPRDLEIFLGRNDSIDLAFHYARSLCDECGITPGRRTFA